MANKDDKNIRRNNSKQIISYTSSSGVYGNLEFLPETSRFKEDDYNRVIDGLSDEIFIDIPDITPAIVSSNWLDKTLLETIESAGTVITRMYLSDSGDHLNISGQFGVVEAQLYDMIHGINKPWSDHALHPMNLDQTDAFWVYYAPPLQPFTQLYTDEAMTEKLVPFYNESFYTIYKHENDSKLKDDLSPAYKTYFHDVKEHIRWYGPGSPKDTYFPFTHMWEPLHEPDVLEIKDTYAGVIDFSGGFVKVNKTDGKVTDLHHMGSSWKGREYLADIVNSRLPTINQTW